LLLNQRPFGSVFHSSLSLRGMNKDVARRTPPITSDAIPNRMRTPRSARLLNALKSRFGLIPNPSGNDSRPTQIIPIPTIFSQSRIVIRSSSRLSQYRVARGEKVPDTFSISHVASQRGRDAPGAGHGHLEDGGKEFLCNWVGIHAGSLPDPASEDWSCIQAGVGPLSQFSSISSTFNCTLSRASNLSCPSISKSS